MNQDLTINHRKFGAAGKRAYRIDEACHCLGIGRTSLYALVKSGELKLIKIAGRSLVPGLQNFSGWTHTHRKNSPVGFPAGFQQVFHAGMVA